MSKNSYHAASSTDGEEETEEEEEEETVEEISFRPLDHPRSSRIGSSREKKLLILDINKLLVDAVYCGGGSDAVDISAYRKPDFIVGKKLVFKRPFCGDFLRFCFDNFHVAIWSTAMMWTINGIVERVLGNLANGLHFIWDQSKCTNSGFNTIEKKDKPLFLKELRKIWNEFKNFSPNNTLLIDDSPYKAILNPPHTAIFPRPYAAAQTEDRALGPGGNLRMFLEGLATSEEEVPSYVAAHPIGQGPITAAHHDWAFYSQIISRSR